MECVPPSIYEEGDECFSNCCTAEKICIVSTGAYEAGSDTVELYKLCVGSSGTSCTDKGSLVFKVEETVVSGRSVY